MTTPLLATRDALAKAIAADLRYCLPDSVAIALGNSGATDEIAAELADALAGLVRDPATLARDARGASQQVGYAMRHAKTAGDLAARLLTSEPMSDEERRKIGHDICESAMRAYLNAKETQKQIAALAAALAEDR